MQHIRQKRQAILISCPNLIRMSTDCPMSIDTDLVHISTSPVVVITDGKTVKIEAGTLCGTISALYKM